MIRIIALGTSGSSPTKQRNMPSFALVHEGDVLLFDCGEGTQMQMLKYGVNISKVRAIFVSHAHGDHTIGIAGLARTLALTARVEPLYIFVPKGYEKVIRNILDFDRALINYPIEIKGIGRGEVYRGKGYTVSSFRLNHTIPTYGYVFKEDDRRRFIEDKAKAAGLKGPMFSELLKKGRLRIGRRTITAASVTRVQIGKKVVYATDTRPNKETVTEAKGADLLIYESAYTEAEKRLALERKHATALEAAEVAKAAKVKELLLTHISARHRRPDPIANEARKVFGNTVVAKDGLVIIIDGEKSKDTEESSSGRTAD